MTGRVRLSTVVLTVVFAGVLALYVQVRPPPVAVAGTGAVETSAVPTLTPMRTPAPTVSRSSESTAAPTSTPARTTAAVPEVAPTSDGARPRPIPETPPPSTSGSAPG